MRIVDITSVVFGAYATQMLGDLGADVIKVESPPGADGEGGDIMRWAGDTPDASVQDLGPVFMTLNRNKRSVVLDLRKDADRAALLKVIATADVFTANIRYDGLKRAGLSYEDVRAVRPDIIYAHASGYGSDGPYAGLAAYDDLIQAGCGLADLLNRTDGDPTPRYMPTLLADKVSGLFLVQAILAALYHRQRTGEGQFVETPMYECVTSFVLAEHFFGQVYEPPTGPWAYGRVTNPYRRPFRTKDGYIGLLPYTDKQWRDFSRVSGHAETLGADPRFVAYQDRAKNIGAFYAAVETITCARTTDEWLALLGPVHVPVVKLNRLEDLPTDPHLQAVGFFERYDHPQAGPYNGLRPPLKFSATPANVRRHPPRLGEHNKEVLDKVDDLEP